jgi:hypothetical protein
MVLPTTVGGGERFALVFDFNILPRLAPPKKSMEKSDLAAPARSPTSRQMIPSNALAVSSSPAAPGVNPNSLYRACA